MKIATTLRAAAAAFLLAVGVSPTSAAVIDLGFILDGSGSVSSSDYASAANALSSALNKIPVTGANQYKVAVTTYGSSSTTVLLPTIVTAANIAAIQTTVKNAVKAGGTTNTAGAIDYMTNLFVSSGGLGDTTLFNITTDGAPNSQIAAEQSASAAILAGVDGISFEAVGSGVSSQTALNNMAKIARPGAPGVIVTDLDQIPDVTKQGFVIAVADFAAYSAAIEAKIGKVVDDTTDPNVVPLPAGLPLIFTAFGAFAGLRVFRKRSA